MRGSKATRAVAELKGLVAKNPQRYLKIEPKSEHPLGLPPAHMNEAAQGVWAELQHYAVPGVMTGAERFPLELASNLLAEYRTDPIGFAIGKFAVLERLLARLGYNPIDRQRLGVQGITKPKAKEDDDFADLVNAKPN